MPERSRAARKCSVAKIANATASKTGPSTRTLPAPEVAPNRARTRKSPTASAATPAPIIPPTTTDIEHLPGSRTNQRPDQGLSMRVYRDHRTHERRGLRRGEPKLVPSTLL